MDLKALAHADYLDIIFDNRNKNYGGYQLRKSYGQRVGKAIAIIYSSLAVLILYALLYKPANAGSLIDRAFDKAAVLTEVELPQQPPVVIPPPKPQAQQPAAAQPNSRLFTEPDITNEVIPADKHMASADELAKSTAGASTNTTGDPGIESPDIKPATNGGGTMPADMKPEVPPTWVEQMPEFRGDINAYMSNNVRYPEVARNSGVEGRVIVQFIVNEDGSISGAHVLRGIGGGCDQEALRVVNAMPRWKPGKQNGRPVKVLYNIPITFVLQ